MRKFDGIAHGINIFCRSHEVIVHFDAAFAKGNAGLLCEFRSRTDTDREQHDVGRNARSIVQANHHATFGCFKAFDRLFQIELYPLVAELLLHQ